MRDVQAREHPLIQWAAQAVPARGVRYDNDDASVVAASSLNRRDRIVVAGVPRAAQPLLDAALTEFPDRWVLGDTGLVTQLGGVVPIAEFGWMELLLSQPVPTVDSSRARWLHDDGAVAELLQVANPDSWVHPGDPAAVAWAGVTTPAPPQRHSPPQRYPPQSHQPARLVSVGAMTHCARDVAFLAGVATHPAHRGRGLSTAVCALLRDEGRRTRGTVALMVDAANTAAIAVYATLGFTYRPVTAARLATLHR